MPPAAAHAPQHERRGGLLVELRRECRLADNQARGLSGEITLAESSLAEY